MASSSSAPPGQRVPRFVRNRCTLQSPAGEVIAECQVLFVSPSDRVYGEQHFPEALTVDEMPGGNGGDLSGADMALVLDSSQGGHVSFSLVTNKAPAQLPSYLKLAKAFERGRISVIRLPLPIISHLYLMSGSTFRSFPALADHFETALDHLAKTYCEQKRITGREAAVKAGMGKQANHLLFGLVVFQEPQGIPPLVDRNISGTLRQLHGSKKEKEAHETPSSGRMESSEGGAPGARASEEVARNETAASIGGSALFPQKSAAAIQGGANSSRQENQEGTHGDQRLEWEASVKVSVGPVRSPGKREGRSDSKAESSGEGERSKDEWFYRNRKGEPRGPYTLERLREALAAEKLAPSLLVFRKSGGSVGPQVKLRTLLQENGGSEVTEVRKRTEERKGMKEQKGKDERYGSGTEERNGMGEGKGTEERNGMGEGKGTEERNGMGEGKGTEAASTELGMTKMGAVPGGNGFPIAASRLKDAEPVPQAVGKPADREGVPSGVRNPAKNAIEQQGFFEGRHTPAERRGVALFGATGAPATSSGEGIPSRSETSREPDNTFGGAQETSSSGRGLSPTTVTEAPVRADKKPGGWAEELRAARAREATALQLGTGPKTNAGEAGDDSLKAATAPSILTPAGLSAKPDTRRAAGRRMVIDLEYDPPGDSSPAKVESIGQPASSFSQVPAGSGEEAAIEEERNDSAGCTNPLAACAVSGAALTSAGPQQAADAIGLPDTQELESPPRTEILFPIVGAAFSPSESKPSAYTATPFQELLPRTVAAPLGEPQAETLAEESPLTSIPGASTKPSPAEQALPLPQLVPPLTEQPVQVNSEALPADASASPATGPFPVAVDFNISSSEQLKPAADGEHTVEAPADAPADGSVYNDLATRPNSSVGPGAPHNGAPRPESAALAPPLAPAFGSFPFPTPSGGQPAWPNLGVTEAAAVLAASILLNSLLPSPTPSNPPLPPGTPPAHAQLPLLQGTPPVYAQQPLQPAPPLPPGPPPPHLLTHNPNLPLNPPPGPPLPNTLPPLPPGPPPVIGPNRVQSPTLLPTSKTSPPLPNAKANPNPPSQMVAPADPLRAFVLVTIVPPETNPGDFFRQTVASLLEKFDVRPAEAKTITRVQPLTESSCLVELQSPELVTLLLDAQLAKRLPFAGTLAAHIGRSRTPNMPPEAALDPGAASELAATWQQEGERRECWFYVCLIREGKEGRAAKAQSALAAWFKIRSPLLLKKDGASLQVVGDHALVRLPKPENVESVFKRLRERPDDLKVSQGLRAFLCRHSEFVPFVDRLAAEHRNGKRAEQSEGPETLFSGQRALGKKVTAGEAPGMVETPQAKTSMGVNKDEKLQAVGVEVERMSRTEGALQAGGLAEVGANGEKKLLAAQPVYAEVAAKGGGQGEAHSREKVSQSGGGKEDRKGAVEATVEKVGVRETAADVSAAERGEHQEGATEAKRKQETAPVFSPPFVPQSAGTEAGSTGKEGTEVEGRPERDPKLSDESGLVSSGEPSDSEAEESRKLDAFARRLFLPEWNPSGGPWSAGELERGFHIAVRRIPERARPRISIHTPKNKNTLPFVEFETPRDAHVFYQEWAVGNLPVFYAGRPVEILPPQLPNSAPERPPPNLSPPPRGPFPAPWRAPRFPPPGPRFPGRPPFLPAPTAWDVVMRPEWGPGLPRGPYPDVLLPPPGGSPGLWMGSPGYRAPGPWFGTGFPGYGDFGPGGPFPRSFDEEGRLSNHPGVYPDDQADSAPGSKTRGGSKEALGSKGALGRHSSLKRPSSEVEKSEEGRKAKRRGSKGESLEDIKGRESRNEDGKREGGGKDKSEERRRGQDLKEGRRGRLESGVRETDREPRRREERDRSRERRRDRERSRGEDYGRGEKSSPPRRRLSRSPSRERGRYRRDRSRERSWERRGRSEDNRAEDERREESRRRDGETERERRSRREKRYREEDDRGIEDERGGEKDRERKSGREMADKRDESRGDKGGTGEREKRSGRERHERKERIPEKEEERGGESGREGEGEPGAKVGLNIGKGAEVQNAQERNEAERTEGKRDGAERNKVGRDEAALDREEPERNEAERKRNRVLEELPGVERKGEGVPEAEHGQDRLSTKVMEGAGIPGQQTKTGKLEGDKRNQETGDGFMALIENEPVRHPALKRAGSSLNGRINQKAIEEARGKIGGPINRGVAVKWGVENNGAGGKHQKSSAAGEAQNKTPDVPADPAVSLAVACAQPTEEPLPTDTATLSARIPSSQPTLDRADSKVSTSSRRTSGLASEVKDGAGTKTPDKVGTSEKSRSGTGSHRDEKTGSGTGTRTEEKSGTERKAKSKDRTPTEQDGTAARGTAKAKRNGTKAEVGTAGTRRKTDSGRQAPPAGADLGPKVPLGKLCEAFSRRQQSGSWGAEAQSPGASGRSGRKQADSGSTKEKVADPENNDAKGAGPTGFAKLGPFEGVDEMAETDTARRETDTKLGSGSGPERVPQLAVFFPGGTSLEAAAVISGMSKESQGPPARHVSGDEGGTTVEDVVREVREPIKALKPLFDLNNSPRDEEDDFF